MVPGAVHLGLLADLYLKALTSAKSDVVLGTLFFLPLGQHLMTGTALGSLIAGQQCRQFSSSR